MNQQPFSLFLWLLLGLLFQILVLSNVHFLGFMNPYYYPVLILMMPATMNQHRLMLLAFFIGLVVDTFEQTGAIHASATTILAYLRPVFLRLVSTQSGRELGSLSMEGLGLKNFILYVSISVYAHHTILFFIDDLRLTNIDLILWRSFRTFLLSISVILLVQGLLLRTKGKSNG